MYHTNKGGLLKKVAGRRLGTPKFHTVGHLTYLTTSSGTGAPLPPVFGNVMGGLAVL